MSDATTTPGTVSLWALARRLGTYPDLLRSLCKRHRIEVVVRRVAGRDCRFVSVLHEDELAGLVADHRSRPLLSRPEKVQPLEY